VIVGITWMTAGPQRGAVPVTALLALVGATVAAGMGIILGKEISRHHPAMTNAVGMTVGASLLLVVSMAAGEDWALPRQPEVAGALAYLVTIGSVGMFVLVLLVVRRWTASASSYLFVLMPVATAVLAAAVAGERLTIQTAVGGAVVMLGAWVGALSQPKGSRDSQRGQESARESNRDPRAERHPAGGRP
jgi:drug/metabolite transporter (DMT)-like permease